MAQAIPRAQWSEAEKHCERSFYWWFLVNEWLVPVDTVLDDGSEREVSFGPSTGEPSDVGWLHEPESLLEQ